MMPAWIKLNALDRDLYHTVHAFLQGRLEEREILDWALNLKPDEKPEDAVKSLALRELLNTTGGRNMKQPWRAAWGLLEESWSHVKGTSIDDYEAQRRLSEGDRSSALIAAIVEHVAPRLKVEPVFRFNKDYERYWEVIGQEQSFPEPPKRPRKIEDLVSVRLTSGEAVDPDVLQLSDLTDRSFLVSLASRLDAAVNSGLDIARRIGFDESRDPYLLGSPSRVYYISAENRAVGERDYEPDYMQKGIAPSVKLLHTVVARLVEIDFASAITYASRWKAMDSPIHLRLWAALSRDSRVTLADEAGDWLLARDNQQFWNRHDYYEISELRTKRFSEFKPQQQAALIARIRKFPPRKEWPKKADAKQVAQSRLYRAVLELNNLEINGVALPSRDKTWLNIKIREFPSLTQLEPKDEISDEAMQNSYDLLTGETLLQTLEDDFSSTQDGSYSDTLRSAVVWLSRRENIGKILTIFESRDDKGADFVNLWKRFFKTHRIDSPSMPTGADEIPCDLPTESARVLALLAKLPDEVIYPAIDDISQWLLQWAEQAVTLPDKLGNIWPRLWSIAVESTASKQAIEGDGSLNISSKYLSDPESIDFDKLNTTPAGKLIRVFLMACPKMVKLGDQPFQENSVLRLMLDTIDTTLEAAGTVVKYQLIEAMPYFLVADRQWTLDNLVRPLLIDSVETPMLWRAVARRQFTTPAVMAVLSDALADRAVDARLDRYTKSTLVSWIVFDCLFAYKNQRSPALSKARIQQMLRTVGDEVRSKGAEAVRRFMQDLSKPSEGEEYSPTPGPLFLSAAKPFLQDVWPQEHSLITPGVSRIMAKLPALAQEAFAEAVAVIEHFLRPLDCWSMADYGLYGELNGKPKLSIIDTDKKASALLTLLNLTIGTAEGSVIPHDLAEALEQIRKVAPPLAKEPIFRRLATAARRR